MPVAVAVAVGVCVAVAVAVVVAVGVGDPVGTLITSCGAFAVSRESNSVASVEDEASTNEYAPFPVTDDETSYSTQVPALTTPRSPRTVDPRAGRLAHEIPDSDHAVEVAYSEGPSTEPVYFPSGTRIRILAPRGDPVIFVTLNVRYVSTSGSLPPSDFSSVDEP